MAKGMWDKLREASENQRKGVADLSKRYGFDGGTNKSTDWIPNLKPKVRKKLGRKKGSKNLTLKERLAKRGYFD